jgi:ferritin-like protein
VCAASGLDEDQARPAPRRYVQVGRAEARFTNEGASMSSEGYHERSDELSEAARDMHRAIQSLVEELEAVDWYNQRVDVCKNPQLRAILAHNRDEEKEHAAMLLEWIRRNDGPFDHELRDYVFSDKPLTHD